jgi:signal peptidase complex subunit 1
MITVQAIAFIVGYILQDIKLALYIGLGGTAVIFALVVPPWPFFNRHPVKWLPVGGGAQIQAPENLVIDHKAIR